MNAAKNKPMQKIKGLILSALGVFSFVGVGVSVHTAQATGAGHFLAMPGGGDWEPEPENGTHSAGPSAQVIGADLYLAMPGGGDWEPEPENETHGVAHSVNT
ncbi:hypothetical protein [Deinococcus humi]|uniref:Uncharacterized protein n=1 Tax=Deinococcus humi TaxID=662880 RepID=A0A7W8JYU6_9DEIO|nr:hypothetical protein [Deinococcus humi]MBB5365674.1 hypothetical protein [Deinococcus humi]GGO37075.1 hypothetical protein GCM10008949_41800 [Deinococcus humi]